MDIRSVSQAYGAQSFGMTAKSGKKVAPEKAAAVRSVNVEISESSLTIQKLENEVKAKPDIRIRMVEEIRHKIKHNGYPLETNIYKAVENIVANNFVWHEVER